jgi:hypothetical protein
MRTPISFLLIPAIVIYGFVFIAQERIFKGNHIDLKIIPSFQLLRAATGYIHQLVAEFFFVNEAVFLGGIKPGVDLVSYAPVLSHNYLQITSLYPEFIDPYYYSQAYLPHLGREFAQDTNNILATGIASHPNSFILRLFAGVNTFQYLDDPVAAAKIFQDASNLKDAPPMFGHLAAILSADGGNLNAAILSLRTMLNVEENETIKSRYQEEIEMFQQAIQVQNAINYYFATTQQYPSSLEALVPTYLKQLPTFGSSFDLVYEQSQVKLKRPTTASRKKIP